MDSKTIDIGVGVALSVLSIAIYLYAEQYVGSGVNRYGPNFFPQALAIMLFVASITLIIRAYKGFALKNLEGIEKQGFIRATITLVISIVYLFMMQILGFYLATLLFLIVTIRFLGQKNFRLNILVSVLVASIVYGIFHYFLMIPLPELMF